MSTILAGAGVAGAIAISSTTNVGAAPGNGEQIFDAPGCAPPQYDGPSAHGRPMVERACARPVAVISAQIRRVREGWRVSFDATRSFDPVGGRIVRYGWTTGPGQFEYGPKVAVLFTRAGVYTAQLRLLNDGGTLGGGAYTVRLQ